MYFREVEALCEAGKANNCGMHNGPGRGRLNSTKQREWLGYVKEMCLRLNHVVGPCSHCTSMLSATLASARPASQGGEHSSMRDAWKRATGV